MIEIKVFGTPDWPDWYGLFYTFRSHRMIPLEKSDPVMKYLYKDQLYRGRNKELSNKTHRNEIETYFTK